MKIVKIIFVSTICILFIYSLGFFVLSVQGKSLQDETTCDSCEDCEAKINGEYDLVRLTKDLEYEERNCLNIIELKNKIFDCQGYRIELNVRGTL